MTRKELKYSEYSPAHEKALKLQLKGYKGIRIDKKEGLWALSWWEKETQTNEQKRTKESS